MKTKKCYFCSSSEEVSYKNTESLRKFLTPTAKIAPTKRTGVCASHQRKLARAIKHARYLALLPFTTR